MGKLILVGDLEAPALKELGRTVSTRGCGLLTREPIWAAKSPGWSPGQPSMATLSRRWLAKWARDWTAIAASFLPCWGIDRDRFCRFGADYLEPALAAQGRRPVVVDPSEAEDDLARDATEL